MVRAETKVIWVLMAQRAPPVAMVLLALKVSPERQVITA